MQYAPNIALPPQMIPLSKKTDDWKEATIDRLHDVARHQLQRNLHMLENYQIVRGKFMYHHYLQDNDYHDLLAALTQEFSVPKHLRHYDIISQVINVLVGEYDKRPDLFRAQAMDENTSNNFMRQKGKMLLDYVLQEINADIDRQLVEKGMDPAREDFESEEEMQMYQEQVAQERQALTPQAIEQYMQTDWMDAAEIWANERIKADNQRFRTHELDKVEFEDMLTVARCYRHFYLRGSQYGEETWNPIPVFYHVSPDIEWVQEGDYVGRMLYLSPGAAITRYGTKMSQKDMEMLEQEDGYASYRGKATATFRPEARVVPYERWDEAQRLEELAGIDESGIIQVHDSEMSGSHYRLYDEGLLEVVEGYWKSFRKIALVTYQDPEDGIVKTTWVDETFVVPKWLRKVEADMIDYEVDMTDTIVWTWQPQVWQFVKISKGRTRLDRDLYIDVRPADFQFKGDDNVWGAQLPVVGRIINNRNSEPMSLVDLMKPHQIGHNLSMNQAYEIMSREVGRFMLYDPNFLPLWKDWGGEDGFEKLMLMARALGAAPADSSQAAKKGSGGFGHFQMVDLDESARILSRFKVAEMFELKALAQVGITPQRLGQVAASETAQGTQVATTQSYSQTEKWFIKFSEYKQRCLTHRLQLAQYIEANELDGTISYIRSDMSRAFIKFAGTKLLLADFWVIIHDSQELIRLTETARQLAINNQNTGAQMLDLWTMISSNSPKEIKNQLEISAKRVQDMENRKMQMDQQQMDVMQQEGEKERLFEAEQAQLDRANELEKEYIRTFGFNQNNSQDSDNNQIPDMLEYDKLNMKAQSEAQALDLKRRQQAAAERQAQAGQELERAKLRQKDREMASRERMKKVDQKIAMANKNKYDKSSKKKK